MSAQEETAAAGNKHETIAAKVAFPLSTEPPFQDSVEPASTLQTIRVAAMKHFGVDEDPNFVYYLTHKRERRSDDDVLSDLAGKAKAVEFRLVKELKNG